MSENSDSKQWWFIVGTWQEDGVTETFSLLDSLQEAEFRLIELEATYYPFVLFNIREYGIGSNINSIYDSPNVLVP